MAQWPGAIPEGPPSSGALGMEAGHQLSLVTVTAVTASVSHGACAQANHCAKASRSRPFQHHSPPWGVGSLQVPTHLRWKQRLRKLRELPEAQQLVVLSQN